jgi:hypothetical protein
MAKKVHNDLDFQSVARLLNLLDAVNPQEPVTLAQLQAAIEGLGWKDSVRFKSTGNVNVASPGSSFDGGTPVANDRILLASQTTQSENGIYIWNGAATPMTRTADASTSNELEGAVVGVEEGTTNAGTQWRQTQVNFTLGSGNVIWTSFGVAAPPASETTSGIAELATQAETDAGTDDARIVTPLKLTNWASRVKKFSGDVGDGSSTQIDITHNFNTNDVQVEVYRKTSPFDSIFCDVERFSVNVVRLRFAAAPTSAQFRVVILA